MSSVTPSSSLSNPIEALQNEVLRLNGELIALKNEKKSQNTQILELAQMIFRERPEMLKDVEELTMKKSLPSRIVTVLTQKVIEISKTMKGLLSTMYNSVLDTYNGIPVELRMVTAAIAVAVIFTGLLLQIPVDASIVSVSTGIIGTDLLNLAAN